jgi:hypothetical protein
MARTRQWIPESYLDSPACTLLVQHPSHLRIPKTRQSWLLLVLLNDNLCLLLRSTCTHLPPLVKLFMNLHLLTAILARSSSAPRPGPPIKLETPLQPDSPVKSETSDGFDNYRYNYPTPYFLPDMPTLSPSRFMSSYRYESRVLFAPTLAFQ